MTDVKTPEWAQDVLAFWFERLKPADWYASDPAIDAELERRFSDVLAEQSGRPAEAFLDEPETARAAILLFDQIPRNIFRGTARAFAYDAEARAVVRGFVGRGWLDDLAEKQAQFVLMPLMHSENLADQDWSVALFEMHAPGALDYARSHREAIARFGRFPHRNELLGRQTTEEEAKAIAEGLSW